MKNKLHTIRKFKMCDYIDYQSDIAVEQCAFSEYCSLHWHDQYELEYFFAGSGFQILNGTRYEFAPGSLHLLAPTDFHELTPCESSDLLKIYFDSSAVTPSLMEKITALPKNMVFSFNSTKKELFDHHFLTLLEIQQQVRDPKHFAKIAKNALETCLILLIEEARLQPALLRQSPAVGDNMAKILTYIHKNFRNQIYLQQLADLVHFSPSYLSKYFHSSMGITLKEYIKNLRMSFAANLIVNSDSSITDICFESGFSSLSTFINEFKKIYTLSPAEYRKAQKKLNQT